MPGNLHKTAYIFILGFLALLVLPHNIQAQTVWPAVSFRKIAGGLNQPAHITHSRDGTKRLFVVEQTGSVKIIKNGFVNPAPFLDISGKISRGQEQGLLSVAFPPGYSLKRYFYVNYTGLNGDTVIARYRVGIVPDLADPNSEEVILTIGQPYANHNGGLLEFGPDGYLYIGVGDGGGSGDPNNNAQNKDSLLGKILRIDVESGINPYAIPSSNPFVGIAGRDEVWALGLRNPWKFTFDSQTNDLYIADVGEDSWEEIDFQPAISRGSENYGWRCYEGNSTFNTSGCIAPNLFAYPVFEYANGANGTCAVSGGYIYRGKYGDLQGIYFLGDYCGGQIWGVRPPPGVSGTQLLQPAAYQWESRLLLDTSHVISAFGVDEDKNLYFADHASGDIFEIEGDPGAITPTPTGNPVTGDANSDGKVDLIDYVIWVNHFGQTASNGFRDGDFNSDTKVDLIDYIIWLNNFGYGT